jgi:truncated hemoglobin YjbI
MGGRAAVQRGTNCFYNKIYADPWLGPFFDGIPREHIESQQVDFMQSVLGGYNQYGRKTPPSGHKHINIIVEVYQTCQKFLKQVFKEAIADLGFINLWLKIPLKREW